MSTEKHECRECHEFRMRGCKHQYQCRHSEKVDTEDAECYFERAPEDSDWRFRT